METNLLTLLHSDGRAFSKLNGALMFLLPKQADAKAPGHYRPITMVHSFAKLVSKLLSLRLAPHLLDIISQNQNAFIRGRTIHDNFKFVQCTTTFLRKRNILMMLLKLDISKAFDTVSWPFLLNVL